MANQTKMISFQQIEETKAYKELSTIKRKMSLSRTNRRQIEYGVNVALHIGFEAWLKQANFNESNQSIVKELVELNALDNV